jgi:hypothetical protein
MMAALSLLTTTFCLPYAVFVTFRLKHQRLELELKQRFIYVLYKHLLDARNRLYNCFWPVTALRQFVATTTTLTATGTAVCPPGVH